MSRGFALSLALAFLLASVLRAAQDDAAALLREAESALVSEPNRAVELASAAVAAAPDRPQTHAVLGRAAAQAGRPDLAVEHLSRAFELDPQATLGDRLRLRLYLASALWETGRYEEAETAFRRATEIAGGGPRGLLAWHQLGRLLLWLGRAQEAVPALERAAALGPQVPDVALDLARALDLEEDPRALAAFARAVVLAPDSPRARWGWAQALRSAGRREEATAEMAAYLDLYRQEQDSVRASGLQRAALDLAWERLRVGDGAGAALAFQKFGESAEALEGWARAEAAQGRHAASVAVLVRAVRHYPESEALTALLRRERLLALPRDP